MSYHDEPAGAKDETPTCDRCRERAATGEWRVTARSRDGVPRQTHTIKTCDECEGFLRVSSDTISVESTEDDDARARNAKDETAISLERGQ